MSAGQRNCYTEIALLVARYSIDDVLLSAAEIVRNIASAEIAGSVEHRTFMDVAHNIEQQRGWLRVVAK